MAQGNTFTGNLGWLATVGMNSAIYSADTPLEVFPAGSIITGAWKTSGDVVDGEYGRAFDTVTNENLLTKALKKQGKKVFGRGYEEPQWDEREEMIRWKERKETSLQDQVEQEMEALNRMSNK